MSWVKQQRTSNIGYCGNPIALAESGFCSKYVAVGVREGQNPTTAIGKPECCRSVSSRKSFHSQKFE